MKHFLFLILTTLLWFSCILADEKLRILIIAPSNKLMATHFQWHHQIASRIAEEEFVEVVYLLGMVESTGEEEEKTENHGKLVIWKRNRYGPGGVDKNVSVNSSPNPVGNVWRVQKNFMPPPNPSGTTHNLDFILKNEALFEELDKLQFNVGIMEIVGVDGLQHGIFHFLPSIKVTVITSSVLPTISHWQLMGYERIVHEIPGLNTAYVGIHEKVEKGEFDEIYANNMLWINPKALAANRTHKIWRRKLCKSKNPRIKKLAQSLPKLKNQFKRASYLLANIQPGVDYEMMEQEVARSENKDKKPKIKFIGGLGLFSADGKVKIGQQLEDETEKIFDKGPVVLVSFGTVVELGVVPAKHSENDPAMDEMVKDNEAKKEAFLEVFKEFEHFDGKHVQFIMKYGKKTELLAKESYRPEFPENVHAKGWLEQMAILEKGPKVFISHCGANSMFEALAFGVPLICIPFFGDQFNNAEALASRKMAVVIDVWADLRDESGKIDPKKEHENEKFKKAIKEALREVLSNAMYKENMEKARQKFLDANPVGVLRDTFKQIHEELAQKHLEEE